MKKEGLPMGFLNDSFLLQSDAARLLYANHAEQMPIFDYHCHLSAEEILKNKQFENITELWLSGDHYKWRLMRANGVDERYITGDAGPFEKFEQWAETISCCYGNPLYHWTHLELLRYFGISETLCKENAKEIYERCNSLLQEETFRARELIVKSNVAVLCTTDDPADDLKSHIALKNDPFYPVQVLPTFRPDKAIHLENEGFTSYVAELGKAAGIEIKTFDDMKTALLNRAEFFKKHGCLLSDHAFGAPNFTACTKQLADAAFQKALAGEPLTAGEIDCYHTQIMMFLGSVYDQLGFAMQLHLGVVRSVNQAMFRLAGADTGFDAIGDDLSVESVLRLLDLMEQQNSLPKTILYSLNPNDNDRLAVAAGCFQKGPERGKIQFGAAWWFNDHRDGMQNQMKALANTGILANFIGMLTDSRSFVSYTRHEYFRRILCNLIGGWVDAGEIPADFEKLGKMVEDICFYNAVRYFDPPTAKEF